MAREVQEEMQELLGQPQPGLPKEQLQRLHEFRELLQALLDELQYLLEELQEQLEEPYTTAADELEAVGPTATVPEARDHRAGPQDGFKEQKAMDRTAANAFKEEQAGVMVIGSAEEIAKAATYEAEIEDRVSLLCPLGPDCEHGEGGRPWKMANHPFRQVLRMVTMHIEITHLHEVEDGSTIQEA